MGWNAPRAVGTPSTRSSLTRAAGIGGAPGLALYRAFPRWRERRGVAAAVRNRLAGRFQRFVLRLGEHWEAKGAWTRRQSFTRAYIETRLAGRDFLSRQMACCVPSAPPEALEVFRALSADVSVVLGCLRPKKPTRSTGQLLDS